MTHYEGTDDERRALDTYIKLMRASETVATHIKRLLAEQNLTISQLGILEALLHLGPLCQTDLGTKLLKSSGNITTVVDNLEKRGLVRRDRNRDDRRYVDVSLTDEGRELIEGYFPEHVREIHQVISPLTAEEQQELGRLCRKLGLAVGAP